MNSLKDAGFDQFRNVIIVVGGAEADRIYTDGDDLTFVETQFMNYDLTGLYALHRYKDHEALQAQAYLYVLDTSTVGPNFPTKFENMSNIEYNQYIGFPRPASNTCAFGRGVLEEFGNNFETQLTKKEGLSFEFGDHRRDMKQVQDFAKNVTLLHERQEHGDDVDLYETGYPRKCFYYEDLDLYKYILWGKSGDITGNVHSLMFDTSMLARRHYRMRRRHRHHRLRHRRA